MGSGSMSRQVSDQFVLDAATIGVLCLILIVFSFTS
jgi:hypothetical protein